MKRNAVVSAVVVVVFAAIVAIAMTFARDGASPADAEPRPGSTGSAASLVREDSHRLGQPGTGKAVFVEFLDFECESCRAAFPIVEDLRTKYAGKVDFVVRYFPIASHKNAKNAALAVEAAAQQGKFEDMYKRMYETQTQWGEQQESKAPLFRTFAQDLNLDMAAYDKAVADDATAERVEQDRRDGLELGVKGTPTFFLNGKILEAASVQDLHDQIDAALRG